MAEAQHGIVCPKGHISTDVEYCSECGAKLQAGSEVTPTSLPDAHGGALASCPDCGINREAPAARFCEVCGYNFVTGARGEIAPITPADADPAEHGLTTLPREPEAPGDSAIRWQLEVLTPPDHPTDSNTSEEAITSYLDLTKASYLIGRRDEARAITPEIDLSADDAVSRRHAILTYDEAGGLSLRDIGAANGTKLNGAELEPMVDYPLKAGDQITLGHGSRLQVQVAEQAL